MGFVLEEYFKVHIIWKILIKSSSIQHTMYILSKKKKNYNTKKNEKQHHKWNVEKKHFQYYWHNLHPHALTYLSLILALLMLQYYYPYSQLSIWTNNALLLSCHCYWKGQLLLLQINLVNHLDVALPWTTQIILLILSLHCHHWNWNYTLILNVLSFSSPSALFNSE